MYLKMNVYTNVHYIHQCAFCVYCCYAVTFSLNTGFICGNMNYCLLRHCPCVCSKMRVSQFIVWNNCHVESVICSVITNNKLWVYLHFKHHHLSVCCCFLLLIVLHKLYFEWVTLTQVRQQTFQVYRQQGLRQQV